MLKKKLSSNIPIEIFVDGASRGNPGHAGAGVYVKQDDIELVKKGFYLDKRTNNQAEYLALALAVFFTKKLLDDTTFDSKVIITTDSELLVKQMNGEYRVKNPALKQIKELITSVLEDVDFKVRHVLRDKNKIADRLANEGIDKKNKIPAGFVCLLEKHDIEVS